MKMWTRFVGLLLFLVNFAHAATPPQTFDYGPLPRHQLDLYQTEKAGAPLLIFVHGGAWVSGGKDSYRALGKVFSNHRVSAVIINYRLSGEEAPVRYPEHVKDVALAVDYVAAHAAEWGADPQRIFLMGHSAGAHMAAALASDPQFAGSGTKLKGFIGLEGIYDLPALVKRWPSYRDWFVSLAFGDAKKWKAASPRFSKKTLHAPWLLVHSTKDELVDDNQTRAYAAHLKKQRVPVRLDVSSHQSHFGVVEEIQRGGALFKTVLAFVNE